MTHDELLAHIDNYLIPTMQREPGPQNAAIGILKAFRAVVELHKPLSDKMQFCMECKSQYNGKPDVVAYPCLTIQVIEKELG